MKTIIAIFALFAISAQAYDSSLPSAISYQSQVVVQQPTHYTEYAQPIQLDNSFLAPAPKVVIQQPTQTNCRIVGQQVWCESY